MDNFIYKKKWYSGATPVNPKKATGTLTISGVVADGQTVTIGSKVYEFDTNSTVTAGNIAVDVSGGLTAPAAVTALVSAITANDKVVDAVDGAGDTVVVTAKAVGTGGNVASTETMTNGSWGDVTLTGGQYGTPCPEKNTLVFASPYYYLCTIGGNRDDVEWKRFTPATY